MTTTGFTVFLTYLFEDTPASLSTSYGYNTALHCAYVQELSTDSLSSKALNFFFPNVDELKFLADDTTINGTGFTATKLIALVQVKNGQSDSENKIKPDSNGWYKVDVTDQIGNLGSSGHTVGNIISKSDLTNSLFNIELSSLVEKYNLSYIAYPSNVAPDSEMGFGEEAFFFGNVQSDIKATVYTADIAINLPLENYNTSTNPTWDGESPVTISEIGIYDNENNLVAIGKLNYPITKDSSIARAISFQLDF